MSTSNVYARIRVERSEPPPRTIQGRTEPYSGRSWAKWIAWAGFIALVVSALAVSGVLLAVSMYILGFSWLLTFGAIGVHRRRPVVHPEVPQCSCVRIIP
jgi:hypothetical protein